ISSPSTEIWPELGESRPAIRPRRVDLPLPEAPVSATNWPSGMSSETSERIVRSETPDRTVFVTFCKEIIRVWLPRVYAPGRRKVKLYYGSGGCAVPTKRLAAA